MMVILAVAAIAVGPQDIPKVMQGAGRLWRRLSYMRFAAGQQFEDFMAKAEMGDISDQVNFEAHKTHTPEDLDEYDEAAADESEDVTPHER